MRASTAAGPECQWFQSLARFLAQLLVVNSNCDAKGWQPDCDVQQRRGLPRPRHSVHTDVVASPHCFHDAELLIQGSAQARAAARRCRNAWQRHRRRTQQAQKEARVAVLRLARAPKDFLGIAHKTVQRPRLRPLERHIRIKLHTHGEDNVFGQRLEKCSKLRCSLSHSPLRCARRRRWRRGGRFTQAGSRWIRVE